MSGMAFSEADVTVGGLGIDGLHSQQGNMEDIDREMLYTEASKMSNGKK